MYLRHHFDNTLVFFSSHSLQVEFNGPLFFHGHYSLLSREASLFHQAPQRHSHFKCLLESVPKFTLLAFHSNSRDWNLVIVILGTELILPIWVPWLPFFGFLIFQIRLTYLLGRRLFSIKASYSFFQGGTLQKGLLTQF